MPEVRQRKTQKRKSNVKSGGYPASNRPTEKGLETFSLLLRVIVVVTVGAVLVGYYRSPIYAEEVHLPPEVSLEKHVKGGVGALEKGEHIIPGLIGPESLDIDEHGNLYTGLANGRLVKVHPSATGAIGEGLVEDVMKGPIPGVKAVDGHVAPRPLGLRLHRGHLYVADAYYGLYSLNLATKEIKVLVAPDQVEPSMKFPNDLCITKNGEYIYFTDSGYKWNLEDLYHHVLEGSCTGRFFRYEVKTGNIKVLASKLCFPNGVQLDESEEIALVSETTLFRVLFIDTKHGKVLRYTLFPGTPDNIRKSERGGYWVALPIARSNLYNFMMKYPFLRKLAIGLIPMKLIRQLSNTKVGMAVKLNAEGEILDVVYDNTGKVSSTVSEVYETKDGILFAGSYKEPYMVKVKH